MDNMTFSSPKDFTIGLSPLGGLEELWFIFSGDQLLVSVDKKRVPSASLLLKNHTLYLGKFNQVDIYTSSVLEEAPLPAEWTWSDLRSLFNVMDEDLHALAGRALQMIDWDRTNTFCGKMWL